MTVKKRVLLVFGTRPEAIKMAPVYDRLRAASDRFEPICCVTGQHRELLDQALASFGIVPDIDLGLMRAGQQPHDVSAAVLSQLGAVLSRTTPQLVLVHGDTTTTMASALAAFHARIPIGHVEAGLRSGSLSAPFPEEFNRRTTSMVASYHFAPTARNRANLLREGCDPSRIFVTGNKVIDALLAMAARLDADADLARTVRRELAAMIGFDWQTVPFVLVTCHRREAFGDGIADICRALGELAERYSQFRFILPVHPNPHVERAVREHLGSFANVRLTPPLRYELFVTLLRACRLVLTDSGGVQEEAPSFGKPVLVMRAVTERPEAIAQSRAQLVGLDASVIAAKAAPFLERTRNPRYAGDTSNPYGDGRAAERIVDALR